MDWRILGAVTVGGAIGSAARYLVAGAATKSDFPMGTLVVNVAGCFLIGLLLFGGMEAGWLSPTGRAFLAVGVLGGFTTMSTFSYETLWLVQHAQWVAATVNVAATFGACLAAVWLGWLVSVVLWSSGGP